MSNSTLKDTIISLPVYAWLFVFILIPMLIILVISISHYAIDAPPFRLWTEDGTTFSPTLENFFILAKEPIYLKAFLSSIKLALISSILCLLAGYPIALSMTNSSARIRALLIMLIMLPFLTSLVIRVYAWKAILGDYGVMNKLLLSWRLIKYPLQFLSSNTAVIIGIVYCYLPFMVLPLFVAIERIDKSLIEASIDLGCTPFQSFAKVTLPLSMPGIISGLILVFTPVVGEYVIPDLLKNHALLTVGKVIWSEFFINIDWPVATALTISITALFLVPIIVLQHILVTTKE
jgi:putrescine transport system permease protein